MNDSKWFMVSMTVWGMIIMGWPAVATLLGQEAPDAAVVQQIRELGESILGQLSQLIGVVITVLGLRRTKAEKLTVLPKRKSGKMSSPPLVGAIALILAAVVGLSACPNMPYSTDAKAARIQQLEDFCLTYGAMRDVASGFIETDVERDEPILTLPLIEGYELARGSIQPFCKPEFDPESEPFDLAELEKQLRAIRLILLKKEQSQ